MNREQCEKIIGQALDQIRTAMEIFCPDFNIISMYISPDRSAAWAFEPGEKADGEERDYILDLDLEHKAEDDDDDTDC